MKWISGSGWSFIAYGLAVCGYFSTALVKHWRAPDLPAGDGSSYSSGSSYGRSSGGSWGGGK